MQQQQQPRQSPGPQVMSPKAEVQHEHERAMDVQKAGVGGMAQGVIERFLSAVQGYLDMFRPN